MAKNQSQTETKGAEQGVSADDERTYSRTQEHVWKVKGTGTEIHKKYDGLELRQTLAGYGRDAAEAMDNMLALTGGNWHAVTDLFNSAFRLSAQKHTKDAPMGTVTEKVKNADGTETTRTVEPTATADELQSRILGFVGQEINRKGEGKDARRKEEKAKASLLDQLAATDDPEAALALLAQIRERRAAGGQ